MSLLTVILPTHNPDRGRLARTLAGLRAQTLAPDDWEVVIVDNASTPPLDPAGLAETATISRLIREPTLGLTFARLAGLRAAQGEFVVFVDDDNVLAPDYLAQCVEIFRRHPRLGAAGGRSLAEFAIPPAAWQQEFYGLLALRDLGPAAQIAITLRPTGTDKNQYPDCAPIGAGMALRREAAQSWLEALAVDGLRRPSDRTGRSLSSGGDNDIALTLLGSGWSLGYFPELSLIHLIPAERLQPDYLARLNRGIQKSWVQILALHDASPWPPVAAWTVPLRKLKAWFAHRAWQGPAEFIRWRGACGHFEGRANPAAHSASSP